MAPNVDSAIVKALSLDLSTTSLTSHGGSNFSSTYKLTSKTEQGDERGYFIKTAKEKDAEVMFAGINPFTLLLPQLVCNKTTQ